MTNAEKMRYHLRAMEINAASVERLEKNALVAAQEARGSRISSLLGRSTPDQYWADKDLESNFWYKKLVGARDGHRRAAQVYALAALVDLGLPDIGQL